MLLLAKMAVVLHIVLLRLAVFLLPAVSIWKDVPELCRINLIYSVPKKWEICRIQMSMIFWYMGSSFHGSISVIIIAQRTAATLMKPPWRTTIVYNITVSQNHTVRTLSLSLSGLASVYVLRIYFIF
jgi:hypothetical protein